MSHEAVSAYHENVSTALRWMGEYMRRGFKVDYWLADDGRRYITTAKREGA